MTSVDPCVLCQLSPCQCRPLRKKGVAHMTPEEASKIEHRLNEQFAYLQHIDTMPAGPELDRLVCKAVGIEPLPGLYEQEIVRIDGKAYSDGPMVPIYPPVSTKPGPAMEVVEKMGLCVWPTKDGRWFVHQGRFDTRYGEEYWFGGSYFPDPDDHTVADTMPLAVSRAAYKAKMGER